MAGNLSSQFDNAPRELPPPKMMSLAEIGGMRSMNTAGETSVAEWAATLPKSDQRATKVRGYIKQHGQIPGHLTVTPSHNILVDGHHRYAEAEEAGLTHVPVIDDRNDPRYHK